MSSTNKAIETPSATWGFALLAAIVTVLWQSQEFSLWHTILGITLLLMLTASSSKSQISPSFLLVQSALLSLCVVLIVGPLLRFALEWSGLMAKGIIITEDRQIEWWGELKKENRYDVPCYHIFAFGIWSLVLTTFFIRFRSKTKPAAPAANKPG